MVNTAFTSCLVCELLSVSNKPLKHHIQEFPQFYMHKEYHEVNDPMKTLTKLRNSLQRKGHSFIEVGNDIKLINMEKMEWVLIHPSNTERLIRILAESQLAENAVKLIKTINELIER